MKKLHKNGTPAKIVEGVERGERMTIEDWAAKLNKPRGHVQVALNSARRHGHMLYPIGTGYQQAGILMNVADDPEYFRETQERLSNGYTNPFIASAFHLLESVAQQCPELVAEIETNATKLLMGVLEKKEELKLGMSQHEDTGNTDN